MEQSTDELYSLFIPLHESRLIVPRSCVAEVIRYSEPHNRPASGPDWFQGHIDWNGRQVPLISLELLCGLPAVSPGGRTRIAIFNGISEALPGRIFAMLTEGFPQLVRVNRGVMELHDETDWPDDSPIICQIRMINEYPLIPDLETIEERVQDQVADAA